MPSSVGLLVVVLEGMNGELPIFVALSMGTHGAGASVWEVRHTPTGFKTR